ncbi:hypothetical protein QQP08_017080 [Theobroma cacao]|nr:hypothetical protein QQP08_017080 [Theobroma cacao]
MCALNSHLFPSYGCSENSASHEQSTLSKNTAILESPFHFPSPESQIDLDQSLTGAVASTSNPTVSKKLNHNAKE